MGVYIIALSVALAFFAMWLMSNGINDSREFRMYFAESVSGLNVGSPVKYRGVNVGLVKNIAIDKRDQSLIKVNVELDGSTPVKTDTVASLKLQGITGAIFVELSGSTSGATDLAESQPNTKIPVIATEQSSITAIMTQLPQIVDKISHFADQIAKLTTDENIAKLGDTLNNLNQASAEMRDVLNGTKGTIIESTEQISGTMTHLRRASRDINEVTDRVADNPSSLIFPPAEEGVPAP